MRSVFLILTSLVFACPLLLAQSSNSEALESHADESISQSTGINVSGFEVLSKSRGKDPSFYPGSVLGAVRKKWYPLIKQLRTSNELSQGTTIVEMAIKKDGALASLRMAESSGRESLDKAAMRAIESSAPFGRVPDDYRGKIFNMQVYFGYSQPINPAAAPCHGRGSVDHLADGTIVHRIGNGVEAPHPVYSPDPEFSEEARKSKHQSVVILGGIVDPTGTIADLCILQGAGMGLDEKSIGTVRNWRFEPATLQGTPVAAYISVQVAFRLY